MAVGPQYQSQLALLAGALSHGLDPTQGYDIYNQTVQAAQAARAQRQQEIQQSLGALSQMAVQAATSGATPEQVGALVHASEAGLPHQGSQAIQHGVHKIMGSLSDYQATPDPMAQAQLQGQLLQNQQSALDLQQSAATGGLDVSKETVYGPAHQQEVAQMTQQYLASGATVPEIRQRIVSQLIPDFTQDVTMPVKGIPGKTTTQQQVEPGVMDAINRDISATIAQSSTPVAGTGMTGQEWASNNLVNFGYKPPANPNPPPPQGALTQPPDGNPWMNAISTGLGLFRGLMGNPGGQSY